VQDLYRTAYLACRLDEGYVPMRDGEKDVHMEAGIEAGIPNVSVLLI
jgi:hypothetical protein